MSATEELAGSALPDDEVGLLEGLTTTRSIRRYTDEPIGAWGSVRLYVATKDA